MSGRNLVDGYMAELTDATRVLPKARREELIGEVREHIEAALDQGAADEAAMRNVLERLGSPAEIVAAEREERESVPEPSRSLTPTRVVIAGLTGLVVLLLALLAGTSGLGAAVMAVAVAVVTPYVWIPLALALLALAARRQPTAGAPAVGSWTPSSRRRVSPSLLGLGTIVVLLLTALLANGLFFMGVLAALMVPLLVLLLLVEIVRGR